MDPQREEERRINSNHGKLDKLSPKTKRAILKDTNKNASLKYTDELDLLRGNCKTTFFSRNFKIFLYLVKPALLTLVVVFLYELPLIAVIIIAIVHLVEVYSGLVLKVYSKTVNNIGLAVEGATLLLFSLGAFWIYLVEGKLDNKTSGKKTSLHGWVMIGLVMVAFVLNFVLKMFGRSKL